MQGLKASTFATPMSVLGQKQTLADVRRMSALCQSEHHRSDWNVPGQDDADAVGLTSERAVGAL